jgi:hypothetical protein
MRIGVSLLISAPQSDEVRAALHDAFVDAKARTPT